MSGHLTGTLCVLLSRENLRIEIKDDLFLPLRETTQHWTTFVILSKYFFEQNPDDYFMGKTEVLAFRLACG